MPLPKAPTKPATLLTDIAEAETMAVAAPTEGRVSPAVARKSAPAADADPIEATARAEQPLPSALATRPLPAEPRGTRARPPRIESSVKKLFVLDTNVLMHDPTSLFRFEEHDVYLPIMTLEELDDHKKGMSEVSRNARQVSRTLDSLIAAGGDTSIDDGLALSSLGNRDATGRLYFQTQIVSNLLPASLPTGKADNQILGVVKAMQEARPDRLVALVSKDINMRIKARALGLPAEDYFNDHVLEDTDLLYSGWMALPENFWSRHGKGVESWQQAGQTFYRISGPMVTSFLVNQFVYFEGRDGEAPLYAQVREVTGKTAVLQTLRDYTHNKNAVWGITARNREQNFALNLLMNPECDFVTLLGQAGTGKTLLALASGLSQILDSRRYSEIIVTRATVSVGGDVGFLPGTEEEKMAPWMGAFDDNLAVLMGADNSVGCGFGGSYGGEWGKQASADVLRSKIKVKSMNFMRGRTFVNKYLIIDEAQNLTPKQMKTLVTRAGPGTKVVCLGNIAQIDTPYLTEGSSGLTYVVDRFKGWPHAGHVTLARGERSRLADFASDVL
ncbi:PhoH family protein [soil metagenome]